MKDSCFNWKSCSTDTDAKAIDSIEFAEFPNSELIKVIDNLITNDNIKQILTNRQRYNNLENEEPLQQTAYSSVHKAVLEIEAK